MCGSPPFYICDTNGLLCLRQEAVVVVGLAVRNDPCPAVAILGCDGDGLRCEEVATLLVGVTDDGVAPALKVAPVEALAPELEATVELDLLEQVVARLRARVAGAGAPVSNMTSAYGGIRWESGMSRQFQYEQTQSRIGRDLWSGYDLYVENSPLFKLPNVTTPVLITHNNADGAVPYYQGIEMFMGLRRLSKPAWLIEYNHEAHNLRQRKNMQDLSRRLSEFFDYYLLGAPEPSWMKATTPYVIDGQPVTRE